MDEPDVADIDAAIDGERLSRYQVMVIGLCATTVVFDGFDNQTIGLLAPSIAKSLHLNVAHLGAVFSAGLFGWMIGALTMGPVADRLGRRWTVIGSALCFGVLTLLATAATTVDQLAALWFVNGIGLGGAVPNALALATEFAPRKDESKVASWVITGMPVGAILGGISSATLMPAHGWRAVMYVGGALPLLLSLVLVLWLPESVRFLIAVSAAPERIVKTLRKMLPGFDATQLQHFAREDVADVPVRDLFVADRAVDTVLFWLAFFGNLMILYFVLNWFPAMLQGAGLALSTAVIATTLYSVGGALGAAAMGYLMSALGPRRTTIAQLVLAALLIGVLANEHRLPSLIWSLSMLLGVSVQGAQAGLNALVAAYYPTSVRSTGLGWALGIGRIGSIIGPMLGELVLLLHWSLHDIFMSGMIPALVAAGALIAIALRHRRRSMAPAATPTPSVQAE